MKNGDFTVGQNKTQKNKKQNITIITCSVCAAVILVAILLIASLSSTAKFEYQLSADDGGFIISSYSGNASNVVIPEEYSGLPVVAIADNVFDGNAHIKSVEIPSSVKRLGGKAFANCPKLTTVYFPEKLDSIGMGCFSKCTSLESVVLPEGIKELVSAEFLYCDSLKTVTIPASVESVFYTAFMGCLNLEEIKVASGNSVYTVSGNCLIDKENKELVIGTSKSVIPTDGSVTSIGDGAFYHRASLTKIVIPESVTKIGENAFYSCDSLQSIHVLGATEIGIRAFFGCSKATYVILSNKLTKIDDYAFLQCTSLENIFFTGDSTAWEKVEITEDVDVAFLDAINVAFFSNTAPTEEGSFWHFDESGAPGLWN